MALRDKLETAGSNLSISNGNTPGYPDFALSKLHDTYSINGNPSFAQIPPIGAPSELDLDGNIPAYNYRDNTPEGRTF